MQSSESARNRSFDAGGGNGGWTSPLVAGLRRGTFNLTFPPALEAEYRASHRDAARRWVRMSLMVALATVIGFAIMDRWVLIAPRVPHTDVIRFGLHLPMIVVMMMLTSERFYDRWYQLAVQIAAPLFAAGMVYMALQATPQQLPLLGGRLILVTFFFYLMLGLPFAAALRSNAVLVGGYLVAAAAGRI